MDRSLSKYSRNEQARLLRKERDVLIILCAIELTDLLALVIIEVQILMLEEGRKKKNDSGTKKANERSVSLHENRG